MWTNCCFRNTGLSNYILFETRELLFSTVTHYLCIVNGPNIWSPHIQFCEACLTVENIGLALFSPHETPQNITICKWNYCNEDTRNVWGDETKSYQYLFPSPTLHIAVIFITVKTKKLIFTLQWNEFFHVFHGAVFYKLLQHYLRFLQHMRMALWPMCVALLQFLLPCPFKKKKKLVREHFRLSEVLFIYGISPRRWYKTILY